MLRPIKLLVTTSIQFTLLVCFSATAYSVELRASNEPLDIHAMSDKEKDIIWGFMSELGLPNPFEQPKPTPKPPTPPPAPSPTPTPSDEPTKDDFLWEDDNFLDDPRSFDELKDDFDAQYKAIKAKWDKRLEERLSIWQRPSKDFLNFHDAFVTQTLEASSYLKTDDDTQLSYGNATGKTFRQMNAGDFHVVPHSMKIPIQSQGYRGTCVAFSYVRGMESIFASHGTTVDLSENHFYWLAKDQCRIPGNCRCTAAQRKNPANKCVGDGLIPSKTAQVFKQNSANLYTVTESSCPYKIYPYPQELTGAPLKECQPFTNPVAKPSGAKKLKSFPSVINALLNNEPVVIGVAVSKNMMAKNSTPNKQRIGQVINTLRGDAPDEGGHAMLAIGLIKLQQKYWQSEGQYCVITANSWGEKFGVGGYTCFTEKWLKKYLGQAVTLSSLDVTDSYYPE